MIVEAILVLSMGGYKAGMALDHIAFESMKQCLHAKKEIETANPNNFISYSIKATCLEVVQ